MTLLGIRDDGEGWKLNRTSYYNEGWLATGNVRGIVGVTYTSSLYDCWGFELPQRTNYNLRGHRSEVMIVKWNEPYQKLASCDASGVIFVWIKYEGRWSIELINDRNTRVTHFSWSHDGRLAVICYQHPVTALTWGHNDRRIFVATGPEVHIAWVSTRISSLQLICSLQIYKEIAQGSKQTVYQLPLPNRIRQIISKLFMHTIRCPVPVGSNVRDFVSRATRHRLSLCAYRLYIPIGDR
ncbi:tubby-related protein 4-like [Diaphorina citri]|uniref:Tubby-related protein 4-like n=1 Tax=Diaphorina citri TaxID=121845 RepID=A0A3Q0IZE6_DIACI|nr:tubby-related protein 4-like [Diaphorina citri]